VPRLSEHYIEGIEYSIDKLPEGVADTLQTLYRVYVLTSRDISKGSPHKKKYKRTTFLQHLKNNLNLNLSQEAADS
jgi:hypothetical protein